MMNEITLKPDINRPQLTSKASKRLIVGCIEDSVSKIVYTDSDGCETPRVLLMIPPYTRIKRLLEVIRDSLHKDNIPSEHLAKDLTISHSILESNGFKGYKQILSTGTWPVEGGAR